MDGWTTLDALGLSSQIIVALVAQAGGDYRVLACESCRDQSGQAALMVELTLPGGPTMLFPLSSKGLALAKEPIVIPTPPTEGHPSLEELQRWIRQSLVFTDRPVS